jgi:hypothetical protein
MRLTITSISLSLTLSLGLALGCAPVEYTGTVAVTTPDLVYVSPGVQVIADYDEPIFYSDGFYWWLYGGVWYRSATYTGGWVHVTLPPTAIVRIRDTHRYRHYRPNGHVVRHRPVPSHRVKRPVVRDHRSEAPHRRDRDHRR